MKAKYFFKITLFRTNVCIKSGMAKKHSADSEWMIQRHPIGVWDCMIAVGRRQVVRPQVSDQRKLEALEYGIVARTLRQTGTY